MKSRIVELCLVLCLAARGLTFAQQFTAVGNDLIYTKGNIGIGNGLAAPQAELDLADIFSPGGKNLLIGNDAYFTDIDQANTLGLFGNQNSTLVSLLLGSAGPVLTGLNGNLGIGSNNPRERLQLGDRFTFHDGGTKVLGLNFSFSGGVDRRLVNAGVAAIRFGQAGDIQLQTAPAGPAGSAVTYPSQGVIIDSVGRVGIGGPPGFQAQLEILDLFGAGAKNLLIGNDAFFTDIDVGNVLGLYGNFDNKIAALKLGSNGPVISGANGNVGIETNAPQARLHVAKSDAIVGEERAIGSNGQVQWLKNVNPANFQEKAVAAALDDDAIYVAGNASIVVGWRLEKRRKDNGDLVVQFGTNGVIVDPPLSRANITSVAVNGGILYVVGHNDTSGVDDSQWITEARSSATGALLWRQTSNPSVNISNVIFNDTANAVAVDNTSVYTAGRSLGPSINRWRIEKRNKTTGALDSTFDGDGIAEFSLSSNTSGEPMALRVDAGALYLAGYDQGWRMQRVDAATGTNVWTTNTNLPDASSAKALVLDDTALYVAGFQVVRLSDLQWRIEKRDRATGALITAFNNGGVLTLNLSGGRDFAEGIALDPTGLYIAGSVSSGSGSNGQWRVEKRDSVTGAPVVGFGSSGVFQENPSASEDVPAGIVADASGVYVVGQDSTPGNGQWRMQKLKGMDLDYQGWIVVAGGNVGVGTKAPSRILTIQQGSVTDPIADKWDTYSSRRWKTDIEPLPNALGTVNQLQGVTFRWKSTGSRDIGLIAEDVGRVLPEIVSFENNGQDAVGLDYARLVAVLIEGMKEQQRQIEQLREIVCTDHSDLPACL